MDNQREKLQKTIFTRFLEQRLRTSGHSDVKINDLVADLADGTLLIKIVECLSGQKYPGKPLKPQKMRILQINNAGAALDFVKKVGIDFKTSPENLVDGHTTFILGMIFKIIIKYMKLDEEDDESADVKEALRLWVKNKVQKYDVGDNEIKTLTKPFHNGLIFCALIHHMRPKLIDYDALSKDKAADNLELALSTAEKYCNVQRYITVKNISELDELGMVVYIYDWYYGISLLTKQDIAARRIGKLADMTKLHDEMKATFDTNTAQLSQWIKDKTAWLSSQEITNTMAGIKSQLDAFFAYKTEEKASKLVEQMDIEALFDDLALRLHNNKRPAYDPPITVAALRAMFADLATTEAETSKKLHSELSRQSHLVRLSERMVSECTQLDTWLREQETILEDRPQVSTMAEAEMQVEHHKFYVESYKSSTSLRQASIDKLVDELVSQQYERAGDMTAAKADMAGKLAASAAKAEAKKAWTEQQLTAQLKINDDLCKDFAAAADAFDTWLKSRKEATSNKDGTLESQLSAVESVLANSEAADKLASISDIAAKITARNIVANPYTQTTENDVVSSSQQFTIASEKRKQLLLDEIKRRDANGISDAQIAEVNDNFDYFDKDKSGALDSREMRMCMQSLGEEITPAEVKSVITKYDKDKNGKISRDEFLTYMLTKLCDTDSKEEILQGFSLLSLDAEVVKEEQLDAVVNELTFKDRHIAYLKTEMTAKDGGFDHKDWVEKAFAR